MYGCPFESLFGAPIWPVLASEMVNSERCGGGMLCKQRKGRNEGEHELVRSRLVIFHDEMNNSTATYSSRKNSAQHCGLILKRHSLCRKGGETLSKDRRERRETC
jgi:hypothetical protein